jgi:hypothetical protein
MLDAHVKNGYRTTKECLNEIARVIAHNARPVSNQQAPSEQRAMGSQMRDRLMSILPLCQDTINDT